MALLSGAGVALYLILLDQYGPSQPGANPEHVWFSPRLFADRYGLSDDTRAKGVSDLQDLGLITISRQPVAPEDFGGERVRNAYRLQPATLNTLAMRRTVLASMSIDEEVPADGPSDDAHYLDQAIAHASTDPAVARMGKAIGLFAAGLAMVPKIEWQAVYPNDFAAVACLARALRQLRAACTLMMWGYCAEAYVLLRAAYESSGLGRMLAKDPDRAEDWLRKELWFPDREVRKWFAGSGSNSTGTPEEVHNTYSTVYREMSARSHPTAVTCVSALRIDESGPAPQLETVFDDEEFSACASAIASTALFACFALRNAAVDEEVLDPQWRQAVYELAQEIFNRDMAHLDRDWAEERRQYEQLQARVQSAANLTEKLRRDPRSWVNLKHPSSSNRNG
jgi:hypothetical protein